jgi:hypothetical protein
MDDGVATTPEAARAHSNGGELYRIDLDLAPNEASGLLVVEHQPILDSHGWDRAFWVVLDEGVVERCIAVIGHRRGAPIDDGWGIDRLRANPLANAGRTEDCEALARHDGWVYVLGSQFGSKGGPLQPKRGFVARFREDAVRPGPRGPSVDLQVSRPQFALHRLINDAFAEHGVDLVPLGPRSRAAFIDATIKRGRDRDKRWVGQIRQGDYPLNVEGAAFRPDGTLLFGLRFPTTANGRPILVELEGVQTLFGEGTGAPSVLGFWALDAVGRDGDMAGVRDLTVRDDELHVVTGNLDAREKGSIILEDYPGGAETVSTHWSLPLPPPHAPRRNGSCAVLAAERVREFPDLPRIEGISSDPGGTFFYVSDEDEGVQVCHTELVTAAGEG